MKALKCCKRIRLNQEQHFTIHDLFSNSHTKNILKDENQLPDLLFLTMSPASNNQELEMRIDTQKQTLTARDESIKKLLEMLQNKGEGEMK